MNFKYTGKHFAVALATAGIALVTLLFIIKANVKPSTLIINGQEYEYRGFPDIEGNCVTFIEAKSNNLMTICTEYERNPSSSKN